jgi:DNA-directed RNA polymerase specialized sigma24 family protein
LFDIASQKALDIVQRIQSGAWNPQPMRAAQWVVFVRRVARNSVIDVQRSRHREPISHETLAGDGDSLLASFDFRRAQDPSNDLDRARFAKAFFECIRLLTRKAATIFFFRVFYEFSSSQIASHEEVRMNAKAVDVALVRARKAMSGCLARKGFTSSEIPTGVYAELWDYFERART